MLPIEWIRKVPQARKADFEKTILGSTIALGRMKEIIREFEAEVERFETTATAYDNPSWAYKQAHNNGLKAAYKRLGDLLSFIKD